VRRLIIAIDGPAASGKSTTAKLVAERLGYNYLDTGAMYRALTLKALRQGVDGEDENKLCQLASSLKLDFSVEDGRFKVFMNGEDVSQEIRIPQVSRMVSAVSRHPRVRRVMVGKQRKIGEKGGVVVEGRDIGTVVFLQADLKIYLDASASERAKRRMEELKGEGVNTSLSEQLAALAERDRMDSQREDSPLRKAEDAILIDTTSLSIEEEVEAVLDLIKRRG
jgi:cytidylate kinase